MREELLEVVDLDACPVFFVAGDEFFVEGVVLVEVVGGGVVEENGEADGVGVVDDVARGHGGEAGLEGADGGDFGKKFAATGGEALGFIGGGGGFEPEKDGVGEHEGLCLRAGIVEKCTIEYETVRFSAR